MLATNNATIRSYIEKLAAVISKKQKGDAQDA